VGALLAPAWPALVFSDVTLNYAQLDARVDGWVRSLSQHGISAGDRVAVLSHNSGDLVAVLVALTRLDVVVFPLNTRLTKDEIDPIMARINARWTLCDAAHASRLRQPLVLDELRPNDDGPPTPAVVQQEHIGTVVLTSGTTGIPKGAALQHRAFRVHAAMCAGFLGRSPAHRWLVTMPLFHVGGLSMMWRCFFSGGTLAVHARFDAETALEALLTQGITHASMVPTTLRRVVLLQRGKRFPSQVRAILVGGGPVDPAIMDEARDAGLPAMETYGLTESCSQACTQRTPEGHGAGPPLPGVEIRIVDGVIHLRTPSVMAGYLDQPEATAAMLSDGWLATGDLGTLDERGHLHVFSRRTDLILRGGENVYPAEVEHLVLSIPGVLDAAVFAAPDDDLGQVPVAAVVLSSETAVEAVRAAVEPRLARFKRPVAWHVLRELPRNAMGKLDRARLTRLVQPA